MQRSCGDTPPAPAAPIFSYWCGHLGTLEPGSRSEGQLEPPEPCVQAPPALAPVGPSGHAGQGSRWEGERRRAGSDPSSPESPRDLDRVDPLFHPRESSPLGREWDRLALGFEPRGSQPRARALLQVPRYPPAAPPRNARRAGPGQGLRTSRKGPASPVYPTPRNPQPMAPRRQPSARAAGGDWGE